MYTTIISAEQLKNTINENNLIIFDCRFDLMNKDKGYSEYLESHIRGAHYINLESDLSSPASRHSGRHPLPDIRKFTNLLKEMTLKYLKMKMETKDMYGLLERLRGNFFQILNQNQMT